MLEYAFWIENEYFRLCFIIPTEVLAEIFYKCIGFYKYKRNKNASQTKNVKNIIIYIS